MKRRACVVLAAVIAVMGLGQGAMCQDRGEEQVVSAAQTMMYRVAYKDQYGRLWRVNENGSYPEMIESEICGLINAASSSSGSLIATLQYNGTCWQIYNYLSDGQRIALAADSGRSVFLAYDKVNERVYFARNYDDNSGRGDIYNVPSWGGSWTLFAKNAYWGDVIGDRAAFMVEPTAGKRDILTAKFDGTQFAGIGISNADETYAASRGTSVIFNRLVGGKQKNLYIAPATGGSGTALGANSSYDDIFAGNGADRIYFYVDYKNGTNTLKSVLPSGSGAIEYVYYMNAWKEFYGEIGDRLLFSTDAKVYSITKANKSLIEFPLYGRLWGSAIYPYNRFTVFFDRFIYASGTEFGWHSCTTTATNSDNVTLTPQTCKHDVHLSWTSRRIIVTVGCSDKPNNLLRAYESNGKYEVKFGDAYSQAKRYINSSANRHIYAHANAQTGLWNVRSVLLNGTGDVLLAESVDWSYLYMLTVY